MSRGPQQPRLHPHVRALLRALAVVFTMLALVSLTAALAGCGGGDPEDNPDQPTPAVDCKAKPELCA